MIELFNIAILIAAIFLSVMVLIFYYRFYEPYFFPNITENKNVNNIIQKNSTHSQDLLLIKGILPMDSNSSIKFNTINNKSPEYIRFFPSINKEFGNQLTYSFWFNKKNSNYSNKELFYRGTTTHKTPLIMFGENSNELLIKFQTDSNNEIKNNSVRITNKLFNITDHDTWFMVTIIFKDYNDYNNRASGVELSVYLNNALLAVEKIKNETMRINTGEFVILPNASTDAKFSNISGELADIRYFNYALTYNDINDLYQKGFNNEVFKTHLQLKSNKNKQQNMHKINLYNRIRD